jgi:hypothetical protein
MNSATQFSYRCGIKLHPYFSELLYIPNTDRNTTKYAMCAK